MRPAHLTNLVFKTGFTVTAAAAVGSVFTSESVLMVWLTVAALSSGLMAVAGTPPAENPPDMKC